MSDGKDYEIFVQRLQQALLDSEQLTGSGLKNRKIVAFARDRQPPERLSGIFETASGQRNVEVQRNKRIIDKCSNVREFDLYWEYELGGVPYKTVIECKDYVSSVSVEKIDALIGKIHDIPDLKPVFATKTGYQRGAKRKADANGIELLIVREQHDDDWQDRIRGVNMQILLDCPPRITLFRPIIDGKWVKRNTNLNPETPPSISGLNSQIFVEDLAKNETYSLCDLARRLGSISDGYGSLNHKESFENAYLINNGLRLKMVAYEVEYIRSRPLGSTINIDFSKELIGVIEYLSKGTSTAIFRDRIVKDWK